jgi:hypothetical protein
MGECWEGTSPEYIIFARDGAENIVAEITILNPVFRIYLEEDDGSKGYLEKCDLDGHISSKALIESIVSTGGIDEEGASILVKSVCGVDMEEPLPSKLSVNFTFEFEAKERNSP